MASTTMRRMWKLVTSFGYLFEINRLSKIKQSSFLGVCHDADRGISLNGIKYAQIFDSIVDALISRGESVTTVAAPYSKITGQSAYNNPFSLNGMIFRASIRRKLFVLFGRKYHSRLDPVVLGWKRVLSKVGAKYVIAIQPSEPICEAAHLLGIGTCDIQHGVLWPRGYYEPNPTKKTSTPDMVMCWNEESAHNIREFAELNDTQLIVAGNPWLVRFMVPEANDPMVAFFSRLMPQMQSNRRRVLVSLQWKLNHNETDHSPANQGMIDELVAAIKMTKDRVDWWIKVHPAITTMGGTRPLFEFLSNHFGEGSTNVLWKRIVAVPTPILLLACTHHITHHSAVTIEAASCGIPTGLLHPDKQFIRKFFSGQFENGSSYILPRDPAEIARWVLETHTSTVLTNNAIKIAKIRFDGFLDGLCRKVRFADHSPDDWHYVG